MENLKTGIFRTLTDMPYYVFVDSQTQVFIDSDFWRRQVGLREDLFTPPPSYNMQTVEHDTGTVQSRRVLLLSEVIAAVENIPNGTCTWYDYMSEQTQSEILAALRMLEETAHCLHHHVQGMVDGMPVRNWFSV